MSATTTTTTATPAMTSGERLRLTVSDWRTLTKRNLLTYIRKPDLLVFSTIQPVMFVLLFRYVWGGAMQRVLPPSVPYVDFLMPGIKKSTYGTLGGRTRCIADRKSTRLNSSHGSISYAVFC